MDSLSSILGKVRRVAKLSFKNAVRLYEDAILLFDNNRIPSALHTSILSIEELGKYSLYEETWWHNKIKLKGDEKEIQNWLRGTYSHITKQKWFSSYAYQRFISQPLVRIIETGHLEQIKQKATYVGFPRKGKTVDFHKRVNSPFLASKKRTMQYITNMNDFLIMLAVGIRKGVYGLDISEIDDWLAEEKFERHLIKLWPIMRPSTMKQLNKLRKFDDIER